MKIGVLALQGNFREHKLVLESLGAQVAEVRLPSDLEGLQGLVVPGGESTTIGRLAREYGVEQAVRHRFQQGQLALWGTCAGAIWVASDIEGRPDQERLGVADITVARNAYGRQVDSFVHPLEVRGLDPAFPAVFIRAPVLVRVGTRVDILATHDGKTVLARQGRCLISTFHPEMSEDSRIHEYFLKHLCT